MEGMQKFNGATESEIWQQINADMAQHDEILEYAAQIEQLDKTIFFDIDIDLGGGFEGGFETTRFVGIAPAGTTFKFHIHEQDWVNEIGKALGLEDVELGYPELDKAFIIKTNQPETLRLLFADINLRTTLLKYPNCELKLSPENHEPEAQVVLTFNEESAITNPTDLQEIYHLMLSILQHLDKQPV